MKVIKQSVMELIPYKNNARAHSEKQIKRIAESIHEFGFINPIIVDKDNNLIAGHARLAAAKLLNLKEVPTLCVDYLTEEQKQAYIIADNRLGELSEWNNLLLQQELLALQNVNFDLSLIGFEDFKFEELDAVLDEKDDELPDNVETRAKLGDIWQLGHHRVMCGDSTSIEAVEKLLNNQTIELVFTDPPYGIDVVKKDGKLGKSKGYRPVLSDSTTQVAIDSYNLCVNLNIQNLIFWGANYYAPSLASSPCWIVWDKRGGLHRSFSDIEMAWTSLDKPARMFTHIWDGARRDSEKGEKRIHPTQKPIALIAEIFKFFKLGSIVLDLFGGSGSTLIACEKTKRQCFMMELDPYYVDLIIARWEKISKQKAVLL